MDNVTIARPTAQQLDWAEKEIGVLIHWDLPAFQPYDFRAKFGWNPDLSVFNPDRLDTDQWIESAVAMGAKYAVLVAKHCSGFCLWPTDQHDFCVRSTPYKDGKGDVVGEFVKSCHKYGVRPGLYYSCACNGYFGVDDPGRVRNRYFENLTQEELDKRQIEYNHLVEAQLTELWTRYGELFEIWFDGGCIPVEKGGPDVIPLLHKYQPNAVVYQGPEGTKSIVRWIGNEGGHAPYNLFSTVGKYDYFNSSNVCTTDENGVVTSGDPLGDKWIPAETDTPNRYDRWFWAENEEQYVVPPDVLMNYYINSVGRNSDLLMGMVIDRHGRFPEADAKAFREFGELLKKRFGAPIAETKGERVDLTLKVGKPVRDIVLMEEISLGELVYEYHIDAKIAGEWKTIIQARSIGHKRIFTPDIKEVVEELRFVCDKSKSQPRIRRFAAYGD